MAKYKIYDITFDNGHSIYLIAKNIDEVKKELKDLKIKEQLNKIEILIENG